MAEATEDDTDVMMPDNIHPSDNNDNDDDDLKEAPQTQDEEAQMNAFLEDEVEVDANNNTTKHGLFNRIGKMFKKKKKSLSQSNDDKDTNDTVQSHEIADANDVQPNDAQITKQLTDLVGGDLWNCEKCTFVNEASELHCVICFYSRFEVKNLSAQWQWKAAERWITYGIPETTEIENAYKNDAKEVSLTTGWFAQNPNLYKIYFDIEYGNKKVSKKKKHHANNDEQHEYDDNSTYFYQVNKDTSTRREVRRISSDDENLFRKLSLDELHEKDRKCMICLHEFSVKDEANGLIVQLSTCKNHGFHKECIVQWVQLKGNCPLCRIDVDAK